MAQGDTAEDDCETIVARGWVMRRGHCKRLQAPKQERAAIWAGIQGQGNEVMRGRAVFKRSVGGKRQRCRHCSSFWCRGGCVPEWSIQQQRNKLRKFAQADAEETRRNNLHTWRPADFDIFFEETIQDDCDELGVQALAPCVSLDLAVMKSWSALSDDDVLSTASKSSSPGCESLSSEASWEMLRTRELKPTSWQLAVARAKFTADAYASSRGIVLHSAGSTEYCRRGRHQTRDRRNQNEIQRQFLRDFGISFTEPAGQQRSDDFEQFRQCFLKQHIKSIGSALNSLSLQGQIEMKPTPLSCEVRQRFLSACNGQVKDAVRPVWHGTDVNSLDSIYQQGLLIPGQNNGLKVKNGSAYGLGIYAARADCPQLSLGYCRGGSRKLLVCGMIDVSEPDSVRHGSNFVVIFNHHLVAPLFETTLPDGSFAPPPIPSLPSQTTQVLTRHAQLPTQRALKKKIVKRKISIAALMPVGVVAAFLSRRAVRKRR